MDYQPDIRESKYASVMEDLCRLMLETKPEKFGVCLMKENGDCACLYWGGCGPYDKMAMADHMYADGIMRIVFANARQILKEAEMQEDQDDG